MKKLRLLLFEKCNRSCNGCCNKDWDLSKLPVIQSYKGYDEVLLTGGEPMLEPGLVNDVIGDIRSQNRKAKIFLYTAKTNRPASLSFSLYLLNGLTVTLHDQSNVKYFLNFDRIVYKYNNKCEDLSKKSLRVNIFKGIDISLLSEVKCNWQAKVNIEWIKNCPLPDNETFGRLYITDQFRKDYAEVLK